MSERPFIKLTDREPPVSTDKKRYWLELYIPERVQDNEPARVGLVMGLHLGKGQFRLQGDPNVTTERIGSWRRLCGVSRPVISEKPRFHDVGVAGAKA